MSSKLTILIAVASLAGIANAQVTGVRVRAGYGWSGGINAGGVTRHLQGPELGVDIPLTHLPVVEVNFTADWLLGGQLAHGGDLDGNVYRFLLSARAQVPGSKFSVFGGLGWATAQARNHEFGAFNGQIAQLGFAIPLGMKTPLLAPSLEVCGTMASKTGLSGFSVTVGVHF